MAHCVPMTDRHMVPRWRPFAETTARGELGRESNTHLHRNTGVTTLATHVSDWRRNRTIGHASDLLGVAVVVGDRGPDVMEAAKFLDNSVTDAPVLAKALASTVLSRTSDGPAHTEVTEHAIRAQIRTLKVWTRRDPTDAIAWVELARAYCIVGHVGQGAKCMDIAVGLAPSNRFVLRCAGRFWLHAGDREKGHGCLLRGLGSGTSDPWLMAAAIALSDGAGRRSSLLSRANRLLENSRIPPHDVSELAAEIGTRDSQTKKAYRAKKRFRQALMGPTENSLAQIGWMAQQGNRAARSCVGPIVAKSAFEAKSQHHSQNGEWRQAVIECKKWTHDEPYSSRPTILGSYIAAVGMEDYLECRRLATAGLRANPRNFALLNNKAFACVQMQDIDKAQGILAYLSRFRLEDEERAVYLATSGLVAYRVGKKHKGQRLYREALKRLEAGMQPHSGAVTGARRESFAQAAVNWIREELSATGKLEAVVLTRALEAIRSVRTPISSAIQGRIAELAEMSGGNE